MQNQFKFNIKKFGPINEANLDLNNLTIVGGVNASGKSFSSRLLFCIITALSNEGKKIDNDAIKDLFEDLIKRHDLNFSVISHKNRLSNEISNLMDTWDNYEVSFSYLNNFYSKFEKILEDYEVLNQDLINDLEKIKHVIELHEDKFQYVISVLRFLLISEFGQDQINNFHNAHVNVLMEKSDCKMEYNLEFKDSLNILMDSETQISCREFSNVIYIDSISAMDFQLTGNHIHYHYISLYDYLTREKQNNIGVYDNIDDLINISRKFNNMLNGNFKFNQLDNIFSFESNGKSFDVKNISSGYKQIGVLQKLLVNNQLTRKSFLIFDDPETNLHPEFQIELAQIIVQMVKKLDIMVYINSHSPFIIEALEVYSKKEGIEDLTNFYMCESIDDELNEFNITHINREDLKILYDDLSNPFRVINNIRFDNEINELS